MHPTVLTGKTFGCLSSGLCFWRDLHNHLRWPSLDMPSWRRSWQINNWSTSRQLLPSTAFYIKYYTDYEVCIYGCALAIRLTASIQYEYCHICMCIHTSNCHVSTLYSLVCTIIMHVTRMFPTWLITAWPLDGTHRVSLRGEAWPLEGTHGVF